MTTLICAGGSGTRVLEAVLHMCAAGLGPSDLRTFVIDPDGSNGNVDKTRKLVNRYQECHEAFKTDGHPFFRTKVDLLKSAQGLRVWSPVDKTQKFKNLLNYTDLSPAQKDVVHLLLTDVELDMPMDVGFRGHPALGAAALALLPLYKEDPLWSQFAQAITSEVNERETRVVIVGSVFGGTGASAIHPLVRYLRSLPQINRDKLKVGAVALVPYFRFSASEAAAAGGHVQAEEAAKSEWFALASRSAAEYYEHLRTQNDWDFDAMYWLGDDTPVRVDYCVGGPQQDNPAHFVDLLAACACLDFSSSPPGARACYYSGPQESGDVPDGNVVTWDDIPLSSLDRDTVRKKLHHFHLVGAAHLGFYGPLLNDARLRGSPHCVPWYFDRFSDGSAELSSKDNQERVDALSTYFRENYFPWWDQIHSAGQDRMRLLNRTAWLDGDGRPLHIQMNRFGNLLYPDAVARHGLNPVDTLFEGVVRSAAGVAGAPNPSSTYLSMLSQAALELVEQENRGSIVRGA
jgi:hypothetical protein